MIITKSNDLGINSCSGSQKTADPTLAADASRQRHNAACLTGSALMIAIWFLVYSNLTAFACQPTQFFFHLEDFSKDSYLGNAAGFFIFETPKVLMLLTLVVFVVGIVRSFFTPECARAILAGKRESMTSVLAARIGCGLEAVRDIVGRVWPYVILGLAMGAGIHGYVPEGAMAAFMAKSAWWSVPMSVQIGIPMYTNAAGIIPIAQAHLGKGAALGTVLTFMMSVIALSLPEMIILRKVLKPRSITVFIGVVGTGILLVGFIFNFIM
jgi:uncharacterized membrane protein YraQ (UPF0718 family)